jgi:hypothetical protein
VDGGGEAAELAQHLDARLRWRLILGVLRVGQRARLAEDRAADRQLADVVQQPAHGQVAQRRPRQAECLADLDGQQGDAAASGPRSSRRGRRAGP